MISKERIEESYQLINKHLVKSHTDKDDDSLYVRFNEIIHHMRDLQWDVDSWKRVANYIKDLNKGTE